MLNLENVMESIVINGDLNGDKAPDVLVRTDPRHLEVYFSSEKGPVYTPHRKTTFEVATQGRPVVRDLNGDSQRDIIMIEHSTGKVGIILSDKSN
jgi:hypothetical protein